MKNQAMNHGLQFMIQTMLTKPVIMLSISSKRYVMNVAPIRLYSKKSLGTPWITKQLINACKGKKSIYIKKKTQL